jgi:HEAT repeat protein
MSEEGMEIREISLVILIIHIFSTAPIGTCQSSSDNSSSHSDAQQIVEKMRGISMVAQATGLPGPRERRRVEITQQFRQLGKRAVPAIAQALSDSEVQMRRNAALVLIDLAGAYSAKPIRTGVDSYGVDQTAKIDIRQALPALIKATTDLDSGVRSWAAQALAEIGPDAKKAIPALIRLLSDSEEGPRIGSCIALRCIGPAAKAAIPALSNALNDPSKDVRRFAQDAIEKIQRK